MGINSAFAAYVHIPFCAVRCGYCDFNTYTNLHLPGGGAAANFADTIIREIALSASSLEVSHSEKILLSSVFFGGGTPTMLPAADLVKILQQLQRAFGIAPGAEITTEANPESVTPQALRALKAGGFTRISFGMQSAMPEVLARLERAHTPGQVQRAMASAKELGFDTSLDLIYGAPGESRSDWERSLEAAIALQPDHISAYALTLEPHVPMARRIARGELPEIAPDEQAEKYERADAVLSAAGYEWYEISNWARPGHESRHNLTYWHEGNWWGYGPGAHSHIDGKRWWNLKHPAAYARALESGKLPVEDSEQLSAAEIREEQIMLGIRLREGIAVPSGVTPTTVTRLIADGLLDPVAAAGACGKAPRLKLTLRGRLLADVVTRELW